MIQEFRGLLLRGNVVDLAVAVVIGAAFGAIITSLVDDILTPMLGIFGIPDFSTWAIQVGEAEMRVGLFLSTVLAFVLIAAARASEEDEGPSEVDLLTEIRDELRKA